MKKRRLNKLSIIIITTLILTSFIIPLAAAKKPTSPKLMIRPDEGEPGDVIKIHGWRFTAIEGTEVTLMLYIDDEPFVELRGFETNKNGMFKGTFMIPAVLSGDYNLVAEDGFGLIALTQISVHPPTP